MHTFYGRVDLENEAFLALKEFGADKSEIVVPSLSRLWPSRRVLTAEIVDADAITTAPVGMVIHVTSLVGR